MLDDSGENGSSRGTPECVPAARAEKRSRARTAHRALPRPKHVRHQYAGRGGGWHTGDAHFWVRLDLCLGRARERFPVLVAVMHSEGQVRSPRSD